MTNPITRQVAEEHNALKEHWSAHFSSNLDLNHSASDHTYKHHIAQLMTIYTDTEQKLVDFNFKTKAMVIPMTKLYGTRGRRSSAPEMDKIYHKRENRWDNRTYLTENLHILDPKPGKRDDGHHHHQRRHGTRGGKQQQQLQAESTTFPGGTQGDSLELGQSNSSVLLQGYNNSSSVLLPIEPNRPHSQPVSSASAGVDVVVGRSNSRGKSRSRSSSPAARQRGDSPANNTNKNHVDQNQNQNQNQSHRYEHQTSSNRYLGPNNTNYSFLDSSASFSAGDGEDQAEIAQDLILQSLYRFDCDQEVEIYNKFVLMLTSFDTHDMLLVLQDAFKDAKAATMLESYGGSGRPYGAAAVAAEEEEIRKRQQQGRRKKGQGQGLRQGREPRSGIGKKDHQQQEHQQQGEQDLEIDPRTVNINKTDYVVSKAHQPHGGIRY